MAPLFIRYGDEACVPHAIDDDDEVAYELGPPRSVDSFAPVTIERW